MATPDESTAAFNSERAAQMRRLVRIQKNAIAEIRQQLADARKLITAQLVDVHDDFKRRRLEAMQREIDEALRAFGARARKSSDAAADIAWDAGIDMVRAPLAAGGLSFEPRINPRQLAALRLSLTDLIAGVSTSTINRINAQLAQVIIGTSPASHAVTAIQRLLKSARNRASTILYTELGRIYSASSQASLEDATLRLPGLKKRWVKSAKLHHRPSHVAAHGQLRDADKPFSVGGEQLMYPRAPNASAANSVNCGCLSIPVTDGSTWGASVLRFDQHTQGSRVELVPRNRT